MSSGLLLLLIVVPWLAVRLLTARSLSRIVPLENVQPGFDLAALPPATIVLAARDEEAEIDDAVRSFLAQSLPHLQVIVVDDRSSDRTPAILEGLARGDSRLVVVRVNERPDGWLGKPHALGKGLELSTGDYVLFTDADVKLSRDCLARSIAFCERERVDHLSLFPHLEADSYWHESLHAFFAQVFVGALGRGAVNEDGPRSAIGVGAFGLVRREALLACGGMEELKLQVGEDVALARLLVAGGFRHRILSGHSCLALHWQHGVLGTMRGLEKNTFWGLRFSIAALLLVTILGMLALVPAAGLVAGGSLGTLAFGLWLIGVVAPYAAQQRASGFALRAALAHPVSSIILLATAWNSALRTLARGGISWRGDFFSMAELRAGFKPVSWWRGTATPAGSAHPAPRVQKTTKG